MTMLGSSAAGGITSTSFAIPEGDCRQMGLAQSDDELLCGWLIVLLLSLSSSRAMFVNPLTMDWVNAVPG
ncbi:hypothetical protein MASR2M17_07530 [Aminivibrio sp.]